MSYILGLKVSFFRNKLPGKHARFVGRTYFCWVLLRRRNEHFIYEGLRLEICPNLQQCQTKIHTQSSRWIVLVSGSKDSWWTTNAESQSHVICSHNILFLIPQLSLWTSRWNIWVLSPGGYFVGRSWTCSLCFAAVSKELWSNSCVWWWYFARMVFADMFEWHFSSDWFLVCFLD